MSKSKPKAKPKPASARKPQPAKVAAPPVEVPPDPPPGDALPDDATSEEKIQVLEIQKRRLLDRLRNEQGVFAALSQEREGLVLPTRLAHDEKQPAARRRLAQHDQRLARAERDLGDTKAVLVEIENQIKVQAEAAHIRAMAENADALQSWAVDYSNACQKQEQMLHHLAAYQSHKDDLARRIVETARVARLKERHDGGNELPADVEFALRDEARNDRFAARCRHHLAPWLGRHLDGGSLLSVTGKAQAYHDQEFAAAMSVIRPILDRVKESGGRPGQEGNGSRPAPGRGSGGNLRPSNERLTPSS